MATKDATKTLDMSAEEFLQWNLLQDERYELVDGLPVPLRSMAGARGEHDLLVINLIRELSTQLRGSRCGPRTADTALRTSIKNLRRPDVTIECAPLERGSLEARNPIAVFEVLSPTTRQIDRSVKLQEYQRHPSVRTIVHIDPDVMDVIVFTRAATGLWDHARFDQPGDKVVIPDTSASVQLADMYEGVLPTDNAARA
jgi:Uma2 family endonuclease